MEIKEFVDTNLTVAIQARLQKPREGLHLSDLELCLKKSYYRKLSPQPISDKQGVMYAIALEFSNISTLNQKSSTYAMVSTALQTITKVTR